MIRLWAIVFLSIITEYSCDCRAADEAALSAALRTQRLADVINALDTSGLPAPPFSQEKQLDLKANGTLALIMDALKRERKIARDQSFADPEYTNTPVRTYKYVDRFDSYICLLLADNVRRMILEWAQETVISGQDPARFARVEGIADSVKLSPGRLKVLYGDQLRQDAASLSLKGDELCRAAQRLWQSHGYTEISEGYVGTAQVLTKYMRNRELLTTRLATDYRPIDLALRMINSEEQFRIFLAGTLAFLRRGGDVSKVSESDTRYFDSIMPPEMSQQYEMSVLGRKRFGPSALLFFTSRIPMPVPNHVSDPDDAAPWMLPVFR